MKTIIEKSDPSLFPSSASLISGIRRRPEFGNIEGWPRFQFNNEVKVLYVEDNTFNQAVAKKILHTIGCKLDVVNSGEEAIILLKHTSFDLILMDINMPGMDGLQVTAYIRQILKSDIPIIALTTNTSELDIEDCVEAGMSDHIGKPYNPYQLSM